MKKRIIVSILIGLSLWANAQTIQDPVRDGAQAGRTYLVWNADINHDGILDMMVSEKPTAEEIKDQRQGRGGPSLPTDHYSFAVYTGIQNGLGYLKAGGIDAEILHCYVGNITQLGRYGIVTVDTAIIQDPGEPQAKHGVLKKLVCCYTLEAGQMNKTNLTPLLDDWENNPIYNMYLSESKRTSVQLQEVTP